MSYGKDMIGVITGAGSGIGRALGQCRDPADLLGLCEAHGRRRADPGDQGGDPERQLYRQAARGRDHRRQPRRLDRDHRRYLLPVPSADAINLVRRDTVSGWIISEQEYRVCGHALGFWSNAENREICSDAEGGGDLEPPGAWVNTTAENEGEVTTGWLQEFEDAERALFLLPASRDVRWSDVAQGTAAARNTLLQGWDDGVQGMRVGGRRRLTIPPHMGYRAQGAGGVIPPNATLVFEIELLELPT